MGLRVLRVLPSLSTRIGGPAFVAVGAARHLRDVGVETTIFTTDMAFPQSSRTRVRAGYSEFPPGADQLDVRVFPARQPYRLAYSPSLARALTREMGRFDVVHIDMLFHLPARAASRSAVRLGTPYVVSPVGSLDPRLRSKSRIPKYINDRLWQRAMLDQAALIHYKTEAEASLCEDLAFVPPAYIVPNGVALDTFMAPTSGAGFRARRLRGAMGPVIMNMGRIAYKKGLGRLVEAFATVRKVYPEAVLAIVGPDDEGLRADLERLAVELGAHQSVFFTGMVSGPERAQALAAADVWVLPSDTENFGNAVVEAMAAGVPVVVSPGVNLSQDIEAAGAGRVCRPDPTILAKEIHALLSDPSARRQIGARGRDFARRFDWSVVAPRLRDMYRTATTLETRIYPGSVVARFGEMSADEVATVLDTSADK